jgi:hypothetical protein
MRRECLLRHSRGIKSSLGLAEVGAILDTDPDVGQWAWYSSAYHQYHAILTLMIDLYQNPELPQAARISAVMDHVFGQSSAQTPQLRCAQILRAVRDNMASFLTAIGSADPQSSLFERSVPHPSILDADQEFPTSYSDCYDASQLASTEMADNDIWWLWQPEMQYLDQDSMADYSGLLSEPQTQWTTSNEG